MTPVIAAEALQIADEFHLSEVESLPRLWIGCSAKRGEAVARKAVGITKIGTTKMKPTTEDMDLWWP